MRIVSITFIFFILIGFISAQNKSSEIHYSVADKFDTISGTITPKKVNDYRVNFDLYKVDNVIGEIYDDLLIHNFDVSNNFPANSVYEIKRDKKGFIWLATNKGIVKFDGNTFYKLVLPDSLYNSEVKSLCFDKNGDLWFGVFEKALIKLSGNSIYIFDSITTDLQIRELYVATDSTLWIGYDNGFSKLKNNKFSSFTFNLDKAKSTNRFAITNISEDSYQNIWIGVFGYNILKIHKNTLQEINIDKVTDPIAHYILHKVPKIYELEKNKILLCTRFNGLYLLENNKISPNFDPISEFAKNGTYTNVTLFKDAIYCSTNFGLLKLSKGIDGAKPIQSINIKDQMIYELYTDNNLLFLGKEDGFCTVQKTPINQAVSVNNTIKKLLSINNQMYLTTDKEVFILNDTITKLPIAISQYSIGNNILTDIRNNLFLNILKSSGLNIFNYQNGLVSNKYFSSQEWQNGKWEKSVLPKNAVNNALFINDSLLISFGVNIICVLNFKKGLIEKKISFKDEIFLAIQIPDSSRYVFSTATELFEYNYENNSITNLGKITKEKIQCFIAWKNELWVYTSDGGIHKYDLKNRKIINTIYRKDIRNHTINDIQLINDKTFLISNRGILFFNTKEFETGEINLFRLKMNNFDNNNIGTYNLTYNSDNNKLYYSYQNTLYTLPFKNILSPNTIHVFIPKIEINNTDYSYLLDNNEIYLPYDSTDIKIYLSSINLFLESANRFMYKLEGYDKSWIEISNGNSINYSNILPGEYTLKYKVISENGSISEIQKLKLIITPPFWETWWFKLFLTLFILLLIRAYFIYSKNKANEKLKNENERLQIQNEIIELEQKLLLTQMNPHFIFNSLNSIKVFVQEKEPIEASKYLTDFAVLMRLILESSRKEFIPLEDEIKILRYYLTLEQLRLNKSFEFIISLDRQSEEEAEDIQVPPMFLQPFIENAIIHGLENTSIKGKISLSFTCVNSNELLVEIEDNGIGILASQKLKSENAINHESFAIKITEERAKSFESKYNRIITIKTIDLKELNKNYTGTKVSIVLPIIN